MSADWPLVYVVTLNWNRRDDTLAFLGSCQQLSYPNMRVLVVDNGSADDSLQAITAHFPAVACIATGRNLGFAAGANVGLRHALVHGAAYVLLANNDTLLAPDMLAQLQSAAHERGAAIASPAIYYAAAPERIWWLGGQRNRATLEVKPVHTRSTEPFAVDFVTGCGMLISRACVDAVGLLDEQFFMYYEDSDYCLRVRAAGLPILVVPRARMWHKVATSSGGSDTPGERYAMARSSMLFFRKHAHGWQWPIVALTRAGSAARTWARLLRGGRRAAARAYGRGLRDGFMKSSKC